MTRLAETYLHLNIRLSETDMYQLQVYLNDRAVTFAEGLFRQAPKFMVRVEEGSVRLWIVVAGALYAGISGYGSFRSGVDYAIKDARTFSERVLNDVRNSGISDAEIRRFERRLGVPGKIQRLFRQLDRLQEGGRSLSKAEYEREIQSINRGLDSLFKEVDRKQDRTLILDNLTMEFESRLPERFPIPGPDELPMVGFRKEDFDLPTYHFPQLHRVEDDATRKRRKDEADYQFSTFSSGFRLVPKE